MYIHGDTKHANTYKVASLLGFMLLFPVVVLEILNSTLLGGEIIPWSLIIVLLLLLVYIYVKIGNNCVISPIPWFLLACAIYYGIGPLLFIYGNEASIEYVNQFHLVSEEMYAKTNLLNGISICLVLAFIVITFQFKFKSLPKHQTSDQVLIQFAKYMSLIGFIFEGLTQYLRFMGGEMFVMPGIFYILRDFKNTGLFLYGLLYFRGHKSVSKYFFIMLVFNWIIAITGLMKQEIIEYFLMIFFAYILSKKRNFFATILPVILVLLTYQPLTILTPVLRNVFWNSKAELDSGYSIINLYNKFNTKSSELYSTNRQYLWIRINYTSQQAFAMEQYDLGLPGKSFGNVMWAFVPRILYPDKPIITLGEEFTNLANGRASGSGGTSPGAFGEGYWNEGWFGVVIVCSLLGFLLSVVTQYSNTVIDKNKFHYFPLIIIMLKIGYRIDDWFVATCINSIPMCIFSLFIIIIIYKIIKKGRVQEIK